MKIKTSRKAGFTIVELMIVVAIIGLLAAIAIPSFVRTRSTSQMTACINNLRQIDAAKQRWAMENGKTGTDTPVIADIGPYLGRAGDTSGKGIFCPIDLTKTFATSYTINACNVAPVCLIQPNGDANGDFKHVMPN